MDGYIAGRSDQVVDTAIRVLNNLSKDEVSLECLRTITEASKPDKEDLSLREKIANALNKAADAIERHGDTVKNTAKAPTKQIKSAKNLQDVKVKIKDRGRLKTNARNVQKQIKRSIDNGEDKSAIDKIMQTYHEHKKEIFISIGVCVLIVPALISGIIDGFNDAIDSTSRDAAKFSRDLAKKVKNGEIDPQTASRADAAYASVSKDIMADDESSFAEAIRAINKVTERRGKQ